jgi:hypothetical protein
LLLLWSIGLGLIEAGVQPAYDLRRELVPACSDNSVGCGGPEGRARESCLAVCLVWCVMPGFNALTEAEPQTIAPPSTGRVQRWANYRGQTRSARPLLPPPKA